MQAKKRTYINILVGFIAALIFSYLYLFTIGKNPSSTAAIGVIFVPVIFIISFIVFYIFTASFRKLVGAYLTNKNVFTKDNIIHLFYVAIITIALLYYFISGALIYYQTQAINSMNTQALYAKLQ